MFDALLLSLALGVDAAVVAFAIGLIHHDRTAAPAFRLALWFGGFQALMSFLGWYLAGHINMIKPYAHAGAGFVFLLLALKLFWDVWRESEEDVKGVPQTHHAHLVLAVATSIDALAAGVGMVGFTHPEWSIVLIGIVAFVMTFVGGVAALRARHFPEKSLEIVGGLILLFLGLKNLIAG